MSAEETQEEQQETQEEATPSQIRDIENGIFNMVITLVQTLSVSNDPRQSRAYVVHYLNKLIDGIKLADEQESGAKND